MSKAHMWGPNDHDVDRQSPDVLYYMQLTKLSRHICEGQAAGFTPSRTKECSALKVLPHVCI